MQAMVVFNLFLASENASVAYIKKTSYKKLLLYKFYSLTFMAYQVTKINNKNNKQPNKQKLIIPVNKNQNAFETITVPFRLSPTHPGFHVHTCDPYVLLHPVNYFIKRETCI